MDGVLSLVPGLGKLVGLTGRSQAVEVPKVAVHHIETDPERRARCLKHLLKANHVNYSITRTKKDNNTTTANRLPHALISAYLLGASVEQLNDIYDAQIKQLDPWQASPAELDEDWAEFWGDEAYTRAYVDFFEDKLAMEFAYDWKKVVMHFLFTTEGSRDHGLLVHRLINDGSYLRDVYSWNFMGLIACFQEVRPLSAWLMLSRPTARNWPWRGLASLRSIAVL